MDRLRVHRPRIPGAPLCGQLLKHIEDEAAKKGYTRLYLSTDHVGLYEKYGYTYLENRRDYWGGDTRVLCKNL